MSGRMNCNRKAKKIIFGSLLKGFLSSSGELLTARCGREGVGGMPVAQLLYADGRLCGRVTPANCKPKSFILNIG